MSDDDEPRTVQDELDRMRAGPRPAPDGTEIEDMSVEEHLARLQTRGRDWRGDDRKDR